MLRGHGGPLVSDLGKIAGAMSQAKISAEGMMLFMNDADAIRARGFASVGLAAHCNVCADHAVAERWRVA